MRYPKYDVKIYDNGRWEVYINCGDYTTRLKEGKSETVDFADIHARDAIREDQERIDKAPKMVRKFSVRG